LIIFGYVFPCLSSAKAVITKDDDSLREWLTYWAVFSAFMMVETVLDLLVWKMPLYNEMKIVCILWLSLPGSQGAFRVYNYILKPYFEQYEEDIDDAISKISSRARAQASKHIQGILWQVFLSPQDGLLSELWKLAGFAQRFVNQEKEIKEENDTKALSAHLLQDFKSLLLEGVHVMAGADGCDLRVSRLYLLEETGGCPSLNVVPVLHGDHGGTDHVAATKEEQGHAKSAISIPIFRIMYISLLSPEESGAAGGCDQGGLILIESACNPAEVLLQTPDDMESEALIAGLQILQVNNRTRIARCWKKACAILMVQGKFELQREAFRRLKLNHK
jgi:hypothetical protein